MTFMQFMEIGSVGKSFDQGVKRIFAHTTGVGYDSLSSTYPLSC